MPVLDTGSAVYAAIANGLSNDPSWQVTAVNFNRYDNIAGIQTPEKNTTADGDYPQATLEGPTSYTSTLQTSTETFGTYSDAGCDWREISVMTFKLTVKSDLLPLNVYSPQLMESVNAIRKLGARLGLPWVTSVKVRADSKDTDASVADTNDAVRRIVSTITITVETNIDGVTLMGA